MDTKTDNPGSELRWFWAWLVEMTVQKSNLDNPDAECELWKNLVIITAFDAKEAVRKAEVIGHAEEGDCNGTLNLWGQPAVTRFIGIENIGVIHEELRDGAEILWNLENCKQSQASETIRHHTILIEALERELRS